MSLKGLRRRIDFLDARLLALINERARLVAEVARFKAERGLPVRDAGREREIAARLRRMNRGPLGDVEVERIFNGLLSEFRTFEGARMSPRRETKGTSLTVAVVGLGLMGGSLVRALKAAAAYRVIGVLRPGTRPQPGMAACVDELSDRPERSLAADIVILACPVSESLKFLRRLGPRARPGSLWTDVGSVKAPPCRLAAEVMARGALFVGGHPMAGSEKSGFAHSRPDLFQGATWALCPARNEDRRGLVRARALVETLGARPLVLDAERHDALVAVTSHLPQFAASALAAACARTLRTAHGSKLAGPGLRDTTRLADSDARLWAEIAPFNRRRLRAALEAYMAEIRRARTLTPSRIKELFHRAGQARRRMNPC